MPGTVDLVVQIVPMNMTRDDSSEHTRFLRITHQKERWSLHETGRVPRPIAPSQQIQEALRFGLAYGMPSIYRESSLITAGELPATIQLQTEASVPFMPGVEGKVRLLVDRETGKPLKLHAFGLREWQDRAIEDYKLGITFHVVPGCKPGKPPLGK